jgi:hypothetical protein
MMVIDICKVWSSAASQPGGPIKSGVQGNTAAFAHFDFAPPLALFCARESPCRHRPGGRLCLLVLAAKATQPCPGFSALRRVECHASETWAHSAWSPHLSSLLDYPRAKRKGSAGRRQQVGAAQHHPLCRMERDRDWITDKPLTVKETKKLRSFGLSLHVSRGWKHL